MPPKRLISIKDKLASEAAAAAKSRNDTVLEPQPEASSSSSTTAKKPAFKPNTAEVAKSKTTKDSTADDISSQRERRDAFQKKPRREMLPRTRIEDTMLPSNLAGNIRTTGGSGSKSKSFSGGGGGGGASGGSISLEGFGSKSKTSNGGLTGIGESESGYTGIDQDEDEDGIGKLDERDLVMIADGFAVDDEDAPISLAWSRRVKDREHFLAGKRNSEVKTDVVDKDGDTEMHTFDEFVNPEEKQLFFFQLPNDLPHFASIDKTFGVKKENSADTDGDLEMGGTNLSEGLIGKILVHNSGKMKMVLGGIMLDVDAIPYSDCIQEAISVDPEAKTAHVLGRVSKRFICTPDINDLLSE